MSSIDQDYDSIYEEEEEETEEETAMIIVKFSNNHEQTVQLNPESPTVADALNSLALRFGLNDSSQFIKEWGFTPCHEELKWIDKLWLHNGQILRPSQVLLLGKRLFSKNDELNLLTIPPFIRDLLYCQLLQMYLEGSMFCTAFKAAKLSALAAHVHVCTNDYLMSGRKWLQSYLPPRLVQYDSLLSLIDKNMKDIGQRNLVVVQTAFIKGLMKLDTFGLTMYTVNIESCHSVLGISLKGLFWLDPNTFEPLRFWSSDLIKLIILNGEEEINLNFTTGEELHLESQYAIDISLCIADAHNTPIHRPQSYTLETGEDDDSHNGIEIVDIQQKTPSMGYLSPDAVEVSPRRRRKNSPFGRHEKRRQAFRKKRDLLAKEDSVEDLSLVMGVDFNSIDPSWSVNGVSPVYDLVASTRVDATLRLSRLTSSALSNTFKPKMFTNKRPSMIKELGDLPPPLPPKPFQFTTSFTVQVKKDNNDNNNDPMSPVKRLPPPPPRPPSFQKSVKKPFLSSILSSQMPPPNKPLLPSISSSQMPPPNKPLRPTLSSSQMLPPNKPLRPTLSSSQISTVNPSPVQLAPPPTPLSIQEETSPQRLGMYLIDGYQTPADGQKSRLVQPNEALKDYATLRREFRMFAIKLPNGGIYWELASLYQPIHKVISRLCILIHTEHPDQYELFVEGAILSQLKENTPLAQETSPNDGENQFPCNNGMESMGHVVVSKKNLILPVTDKSTKLDARLTFKDHGITTSRLLSLRSSQQNERLPRMAIKVPDWVKFHQCWLSIVHGNQPCSLQDAITMAAVLYQCYVLDRTEFSSVISSCNIIDFLPIGYSCVKGIEHKILKEREKILSYTRKELEKIYIRGVTSSPLHQAILFPCKEPRRQFLSSSKLVPIILGINYQGIVRVDPRTCQMLDVWNYELFKNWGYSRKSFLIEFESSTYPVKCQQGKWMSLLIDFYVKGILEIKTEREEEPVVNGVADPQILRRPYFVLEDEEEETANTRPNTQYFVLEKVYEELLKVRDKSVPPSPSLPSPALPSPYLTSTSTTNHHHHHHHTNVDTLYVNPHPNQSLIHPDEQTTQHMQRLGALRLEPLRDEDEDEEDEEEEDLDDKHKYWALADSQSSSDWETSEQPEDGEEEEKEDLYDDILGVMSKLRCSKRQIPIISEHVYYLPPDCY